MIPLPNSRRRLKWLHTALIKVNDWCVLGFTTATNSVVESLHHSTLSYEVTALLSLQFRLFNLSINYTLKKMREQVQIFKSIKNDYLSLSPKTIIIQGLAKHIKPKFFMVEIARFELATNAV